MVVNKSLTEGNRALQNFTDRHELTKLFAGYLNDEPSREQILFFHGDGGNGKSLLLQHLMKNCCKRFLEEDWQLLRNTSNPEVANYIQSVTDWECDFEPVPAALLDFGQQPIGDDRPLDAFYGLLMLHKRLVNAARQQGYQLRFPLYELACAWYLKKKGKLTSEQISKLFFLQKKYFC